MTGLWIAVAVLAVAVGVALALPLLRRAEERADRSAYDLNVFRDQLAEVDRDAERGQIDEAEAEALRLEIQRRILNLDTESAAHDMATAKGAPGGRITAVVIAVAVPLAAVALYLHEGSPDQPDRPYAARDIAGEQRQAQGGGNGAPDIGAMVKRLEDRLEESPDDIAGWLMLGRSYIVLNRFDEAMQAYRRAREHAQGDLEVEVAYAEALIRTSPDMRITPEAVKIFEKVKATDPFEPKARYYLGMKKAQSGDVRGALQDWVDLLALSPADAPWVPIIQRQVNRAVDELKVDPTTLTASAEVQKLRQSLPPAKPTPDQPASGSPLSSGPRPGAAPAPGPTREQMQAAQGMSAEDRQAMIASMVQRLADRLKENPDDLEGWQRLERAYRVLGKTEKAEEAARQIRRLSGARPPAAAAPAPGPTREQMQAAQGMTAEDRQKMIASMVERLADRLKENPDDLEGWQRLARAYRVLGRNADADYAELQILRLSK